MTASVPHNDDNAPDVVWLIAHERDNPLILTELELEREAAVNRLERMLTDLLKDGLSVDPSVIGNALDRRYEVSDHDGWFATYWLAAEPVAKDDGMLTAIVSPGAQQRMHLEQPLRR